MNIGSILTLVQFFFAIVIGLYFLNLLRSQQGTKVAVDRESKKELDKLERLRAVRLTQPLAERTRPSRFEDIIGQADGLRALRAALCGPNPQHVIIYGPPGIGKTAAARLVLGEAKRNPESPFAEEARFVEIDATTARFDERGIADPLIGSVHDPIYQGAGAMGIAGIPQPKPGAVTKAHGGVLFIDEIGELHPVQMNKLLKVLEDRKVFLESAYYCAEDANIPRHIKDIFDNGLPADFRLVGATTHLPDDIPPAIRSRCVEVFFRPLRPEEVSQIAANAADRISFEIDPQALLVLRSYAQNGRDAVNIIQVAAGIAQTEGRRGISREDIEWVVASGQYAPRMMFRPPSRPTVGVVCGLAITGPNCGTLIEIEASAAHALHPGEGRLTVTGIIEEEEFSSLHRKLRRKGMARGAVENVLTVLKNLLGVHADDYDLHINFPGGVPTDGPSAGTAVATAIYSAIAGIPVDNRVAITGELSITGDVKPVGGIVAKIQAAGHSSIDTVLIPHENWQELFRKEPRIKVVPVRRLEEVLAHAMAGAPALRGGDAHELTTAAANAAGTAGAAGRGSGPTG
ncbi:MAG: ATP-dependent protease LonB [Bacillota bacterium]|nr:ATP-dependent protease LonB [Bacillota bacterium]